MVEQKIEMNPEMAKAVLRVFKRDASNLQGNEYNPDCGYFHYSGDLLGLDIEFLNKLGFRISVVLARGNALQVHISKKYKIRDEESEA